MLRGINYFSLEKYSELAEIGLKQSYLVTVEPIFFLLKNNEQKSTVYVSGVYIHMQRNDIPC